jgi:hypothetical protein
MSILLFLQSYISAFGDHNLEIRIDFQGLSQSGPRPEVELRTGLCKAQLSSPMPRMSDPICPDPTHCPYPFPMYTHLYTFIFPLIPFRGSASGLQPLPCMSGGFGCVLGPFYGLL